MTDATFDAAAALAEIQNHPRLNEAGMVLIHFGFVRGFDLEGRPVSSLTVHHDAAAVESVRREMLERPGIVDILIRMNHGRLNPGDPIMLAAVAGRTREEVFPVLRELIERLKTEASRKSEEPA